MGDCISRSALRKRIIEFRDKLKKNGQLTLPSGFGVCLDFIAEAPAVDAVEVVRCKDCKYFELDEDGLDVLGVCKCGKIAVSYNGEIYPKETDFCSYGEKKDE